MLEKCDNFPSFFLFPPFCCDTLKMKMLPAINFGLVATYDDMWAGQMFQTLVSI